MSKEAMKLALEALEFIPKSGSMLGTQAETKRLQAIAVMKEALVMQQLSEPCRCGKQTNAWCMANTCSKAQQALDKKAENARELGLDYEPVCNKDPQGCWNVRCQLGKKCKNTPAQQEPVGYFSVNDYGRWEENENQYGQPLYTSPPAQRTWVGLTDEKIGKCIDEVNATSQYGHHHFGWHLQFARAIEAAHGIKEKNT